MTYKLLNKMQDVSLFELLMYAACTVLFILLEGFLPSIESAPKSLANSALFDSKS